MSEAQSEIRVRIKARSTRLSPQPGTSRGVLDAIATNHVLSKLRASSRQKLVAGASFQSWRKGEVICHQEEPASLCWLVLRGEVKLMLYNSSGAALLIDLVLPNQFFGAVFRRDKPVHPCCAVATKQTELLAFRLKDLAAILEGNTAVLEMFLADTYARLCHANEMRGLWLEGTQVRIASLLLHLHGKYGCFIPQTRSTLAELAGTSVETAIRTTNVFVRRGILATSRGLMEIRSLTGLRECAQNGELVL